MNRRGDFDKPDIISQIKEIQFGILSDDEIKKLSVCEIVTSKICDNEGVYDARLGTMENNINCSTCEANNKECPGHFGYIELGIELINPLFPSVVLLYLKCFCFYCSSMLQSKENLMLKGVLQTKKKFKVATDLLMKTTICPHCSQEQPLFFENKTDKSIWMCMSRNKKKSDQSKYPVEVKRIAQVFRNIASDDLSLIGIEAKICHPKDLIMTRLIVLPPRSRPYVINDGMTSDDDLTTKYCEIIKCVNKLKEIRKGEVVSKKGVVKPIEDDDKHSMEQKYIQSIKFHIATLYDNSQQKARVTNDRPIKGLKQRMSGKDGQMRSHLMGKRVDQSGRTVIGPDPLLKINEIRLPKIIADVLTFPVCVYDLNIDEMQEAIEQDKADTVVKKNGTKINLKYAMHTRPTQLVFGDVVIRKGVHIFPDSTLTFELMAGDTIKRRCYDVKEGKSVFTSEELIDVVLPQRKSFKLEVGDVVHVKLTHVNNLSKKHPSTHHVLTNRQPTLHKGSMMANKIIIHDGKSMKLPLSVTNSYNADFDGDEMNLHNPASLPSKVELSEISETTNNIMNIQNAQPNIKIVQDHLLMCRLMTYKWLVMSREDFQQLACSLDIPLSEIIDRVNHIKRTYKRLKLEKPVYNSKALFSIVFPKTLKYKLETKGCEEEPIFEIRHGVIVSGCLNKRVMSSGDGLVPHIFKEYGKVICREFIDNVCRLTYHWIFYRGFTIGYEDCIIKKDNDISSILTKCYMKASMAENESNSRIKELKITRALNEARDVGNKLSKNSLDPENNIQHMVKSGAKGDENNMSQMVGLLGQQNTETGRVELLLCHGTKSLGCYPQDSEITDQELRYESRGFNKSSYMSGLTPPEYWNHCITGRNSIMDITNKTSEAGYIQRRMCKAFENIKVAYDNTVRGPNNHIIQFAYGGNMFAEDRITKTSVGYRCCNIERLVNKINTSIEQCIYSKQFEYTL